MKEIFEIRDALEDLQKRIDNPNSSLYITESLKDIKERIELSLTEIESKWD